MDGTDRSVIENVGAGKPRSAKSTDDWTNWGGIAYAQTGDAYGFRTTFYVPPYESAG